MLLKKVTYFNEFGSLNGSLFKKSTILMFLKFSWDKFKLRSKTQWQAFLLVSGHHVGAHSEGCQHGVSIQISIDLGKTFLPISCLRKNPVTWILARIFEYFHSFFSQIPDLIFWTVLIFVLVKFEWLETENQQSGQWEQVTLDILFFSTRIKISYLWATA